MACGLFRPQFNMWALQLVHAGDDSASEKRLKRLDMEKLKSDKVEGVSGLLRSCVQRLPPSTSL